MGINKNEVSKVRNKLRNKTSVKKGKRLFLSSLRGSETTEAIHKTKGKGIKQSKKPQTH